jgi:hypothetical protein
MSKPEQRLRKKMPAVAKALDEQEWIWDVSRKGHLKLVSPTGQAVYGAGTPSDRRSDMNLLAELKRHGLNLSDDIVRLYVPPKDKALPNETIAAQKAADEAHALELTVQESLKFMNMGEVVKFLGDKFATIIEWRDAGFLQETRNPNGHHRGHYFLRSDVEAFSVSEEYIELRGGPKRQHKEKVVVAPEPVLIEDPSVVRLQMVVTRRSTQEMTLQELAEAVADAIAPKIEDLVRETMRAYFKGVEW